MFLGFFAKAAPLLLEWRTSLLSNGDLTIIYHSPTLIVMLSVPAVICPAILLSQIRCGRGVGFTEDA